MKLDKKLKSFSPCVAVPNWEKIPSTQRNIFEILSNQTEIRLYLLFIHIFIVFLYTDRKLSINGNSSSALENTVFFLLSIYIFLNIVHDMI